MTVQEIIEMVARRSEKERKLTVMTNRRPARLSSYDAKVEECT